MEGQIVYVVVVLHQDREVLHKDLNLAYYDRIEYISPHFEEAKNYYDTISYKDFRYPFVKPLKKFIVKTSLQKEYRNGIINEEEVISGKIEDIPPALLANVLKDYENPIM